MNLQARGANSALMHPRGPACSWYLRTRGGLAPRTTSPRPCRESGADSAALDLRAGSFILVAAFDSEPDADGKGLIGLIS